VAKLALLSSCAWKLAPLTNGAHADVLLPALLCGLVSNIWTGLCFVRLASTITALSVGSLFGIHMHHLCCSSRTPGGIRLPCLHPISHAVSAEASDVDVR
jgi:hypothetical protein